MAQRQWDPYRALGEPSCPLVDIAAIGPQTRVILDFNNLVGVERSNVYLRYMDSDCGRSAQEAVQTLTIQGYSSLTNWTLVESALSKAQYIHEIHWHHHGPIPTRLIKSLERNHPTCRLYYELRFPSSDPFDSSVPFAQPVGKEGEHDIRCTERESVLNSTLLYSLQAHTCYGDYPNPDGLRLIHRILATCPNTRELDLSLSWGGCLALGDPPYAFDFSSYPLANERLPPLEVLKLNGYALANKLNGGRWIEWELSKPQYNFLRWLWYHLPDAVIDWIGYRTIHRLGGTMDYVRRGPVPRSQRRRN